ncbi:putative Structure-specific endonuclease subunit slx1 [Glarea lozoyensis 74030]|uniref:Putative Structure-specific endonuclease subunit slx1 n=1 Tax=Glarea lozoyensis (strain ATCC 74030 / MF5533) TaxID=1104152 RepID=H0EUG9_GLAL7|nr:putative Structure-specific endonuclease subunit slx1 [Glarea lozoyensis 74030]
MTCIVTGFPSHIAALQFESGHPKRPRHSVSSLLSNLHLLLRSPSFSRWPLEIRFFSKTVYQAWVRWTKTVKDPIQDTIRIIKDFPEGGGKGSDDEDAEKGTSNAIIYRRMANLPIDYEAQKGHVEKAQDMVDFEREGSCKLCKQDLEHSSGLYIICPSIGCETVTHMTCLSKHFIEKQDQDELVPIVGKCPGCNSELRWVDLVRELSLRMRGQKEVQSLLKVKRVKKGKDNALSQTIVDSSDDAEDEEDDINEEMDTMQDFASQSVAAPLGDSWHMACDPEESDAESIASSSSYLKTSKINAGPKQKPIPTLHKTIEDSDWDDAEILD